MVAVFLFCKVAVNFRDDMLAVAVGNFYRQFWASQGEDGANDFMPDGRSNIHQNSFVFVMGEVGVNLEGFNRLPLRNIFANFHAIDGYNCRFVALFFCEISMEDGITISFSFHLSIGGRYGINGADFFSECQQPIFIRVAN